MGSLEQGPYIWLPHPGTGTLHLASTPVGLLGSAMEVGGHSRDVKGRPPPPTMGHAGEILGVIYPGYGKHETIFGAFDSR